MTGVGFERPGRRMARDEEAAAAVAPVVMPLVGSDKSDLTVTKDLEVNTGN